MNYIVCRFGYFRHRRKVDFTKPWDFVFEFRGKMGLGSIGFQNSQAPKGGERGGIYTHLSLLNKIRTFFQENPDAEF